MSGTIDGEMKPAVGANAGWRTCRLRTMPAGGIVVANLAGAKRMKAIHTDTFGLLPWVYLLLSAGMFGLAYDVMVHGGRGLFGIGGNPGAAGLALAGLFWLVLALRRFRQVRKAKRAGRDPRIVRVETRP